MLLTVQLEKDTKQNDLYASCNGQTVRLSAGMGTFSLDKPGTYDVCVFSQFRKHAGHFMFALVRSLLFLVFIALFHEGDDWTKEVVPTTFIYRCKLRVEKDTRLIVSVTPSGFGSVLLFGTNVQMQANADISMESFREEKNEAAIRWGLYVVLCRLFSGFAWIFAILFAVFVLADMPYIWTLVSGSLCLAFFCLFGLRERRRASKLKLRLKNAPV